MCQSLEEQITRAAAKAKNLLGQLGPTVWALHELHACTVGRASEIASDPHSNVHTNRCVDSTGSIRARAICDISALIAGIEQSRSSDILSSVGLRDLINRNVVVYAVAVLEQFLDDAGEKLWTDLVGEAQKYSKCGRKLGWPASALTMTSTLAGKPSCVDLRPLPHYVNTGWLVLVRNAIIHSDGRAERARSDACQYKLLDAKGHAPWRPDKWCDQDGRCQRILVWDEESPVKPSADWRNRTFSIAIDHFILPRLRDAQAFVKEAAQALLTRATSNT